MRLNEYHEKRLLRDPEYAAAVKQLEEEERMVATMAVARVVAEAPSDVEALRAKQIEERETVAKTIGYIIDLIRDPRVNKEKYLPKALRQWIAVLTDQERDLATTERRLMLLTVLTTERDEVDLLLDDED